jgi:hypothetical protein
LSVATLGLEVTSSPVTRAAVELDKLSAASAKAEAVSARLGKSSRDSSVDLSKLEASVAQANSILERLVSVGDRANATLDKIASGSARATQAVSRVAPVLNDNARALKASGDAAQLTANQMLNLSRQGNDVITMWALGAQPMQIFASQAGQIYGALQEGPGGVRGSLRALGSDLVGLATRFPIATAAIAAAGVALAGYKLIGGENVRALDDILKDHEDAIDRLGPGWDKAKSAAKNYASESAASVNLSLGRISKEETNRLAEDVAAAISGIEAAMLQETSERSGMVLASRFEPFRDLIGQLRSGALTVLEFRAQVGRISELEPSVRGVAEELDKLTHNASKTAIAISGLPTVVSEAEERLKALQDAIVRVDSLPAQKQLLDLFDKVKEGSIPLGDIIAKLADLEQQNPTFAGAIRALRELAREAWAVGEGLRIAADGYASIGGYNNPRRRPIVDLPDAAPVPDSRPNTEDILAAQERAAAKADKRDPYADVIRSADARIRQLELELSLSGQVGSAVDALRIHQELLNRATQDGNKIGEQQSEQLRQRAAAIAELTEALKRAKLQEDMAFERQQLFRTSEDQQIASRLRGSGLGLDSDEADYIRQTNRIAEYRSLGIDILSGIRDGALSGSENVGEAILDGILDAATNFATKISDRWIEDIVTSGMKSLGLDIGADSAVGTMTVTAGMVTVNGGLGGGLPFQDGKGGGLLGLLGIDRPGTAGSVIKLDEVVSQAFDPAGATKTGIPLSAVTAANGMTAKVASQYADRFQGLFNDLEAAGYKIRSLGAGGYSYRNVAGTNTLSKHSFGEALDINPRENPHSYNFRTDMPSNINEIARRNGLTWGGTWRKPDTMHFQVDKSIESLGGTASSASQAIDRMTTQAVTAGQGLGQFGGGLNDFAKQLSTAFPAAPQAPAGGSGGFLSRLLSVFSGGAANFMGSAQFAASWAAGGAGLYDAGGYTGIGNPAHAAGLVHREEFVFSAPAVKALGVPMLESLHTAARSGRGFRDGGYTGGSTWSPPGATAPKRSVHFNGAPPGYAVAVEEETDDAGNERLDVTFSRLAAAEAAKRSSPLGRQMRAMGASGPRVRR